MMQRACGAFLAAILIAAALGPAGCAKRVPLEGRNFEAQQKVILTLKDGRTLKGQIAPGERVEYRANEAVYRGRVTAVTDDSIQVRDLVVLERPGSYQLLAARLSDARFQLAAPLAPVSVARADIEKVEQVKFDTTTTLRKGSFWAYSGALVLIFLGQR